MAQSYEEFARRRSLNSQSEPKPYAVSAGSVEPRGNVMQQLQYGLMQRMQNGPQANPNPMPMPPNASPYPLQGIFGGTPRRLNVYEDYSSEGYPGTIDDPAMQLLQLILNRR